MKTVTEIWQGLRPVQTDEQLMRLLYVKALRLEAQVVALEAEVASLVEDNAKLVEDLTS